MSFKSKQSPIIRSLSKTHWSRKSFQPNGACITKVIDDNPRLRKPFEVSESGQLVVKVRCDDNFQNEYIVLFFFLTPLKKLK